MRCDGGRQVVRDVARRASSPRVISGAAFGALLAAGWLYYAHEVEPADVEVVPVSLTLSRLAPEFDGYRIVLISDPHADTWMSPGRFLKLVQLVNAEAPDLVAITGDFATYSRFRSKLRHVPGLATPLSRIRAPDGTIAVLGNHDHKVGAAVVRDTLAAGGVVELCNTVRTLRRGDAVLHLCGVDSAHQKMDRLDQVLEELPEEGAAVLFAHEPDLADTSAATGRFDLQLSGHSHGGQVGLPVPRWAFLPRLSRKYPSGLYRAGGMPLYTNRGLGAHPRLRFGCRPEITVLTLKAAQSLSRSAKRQTS